MVSDFDITVIIPTNGRSASLSRAVHSVFSSATHSRVEVIVVDDNPPGSPQQQASWQALARHAQRPDFRYVQHFGRRYPGAARNTGAIASRARWLAFLDDDDVFAPDKLQRQLTALEAQGARFAYTRTLYLRRGLPVAESRYCTEGSPIESVLADISEISCPSVVIERSLFQAVGGFDEDLQRNEDLDFYLRVLTTGTRIICVDAPLTHVHTDSNLHQLSWQDYKATRLTLLARWSNKLPDQAARDRVTTTINAGLCWYALKQGRLRPALRRLARGLGDPAFGAALGAKLLRYLRVNGHLVPFLGRPRPAPVLRTGPPPAFSVLMSVYAHASPSYLDACLASLAAQTLPANELVLVLDGPIPQALRTVVDTWRERLPMLPLALPEQVGLGRALAAGLAHCRHPVIARMDADDVCLPERFARQLPLFADPSLALCGAWIREIEPTSKVLLATRRTPADELTIRRACASYNPFNHMTMVFRREAVLKAGGYHDLPGMEDWYLWSQMLAQGARSTNIPEVLVEVRAGQDLIRRRSGLRYIRSEWRMARERVHLGLSDPVMSGIVFLLRAVPRLLPPALLAHAYRMSRS